MAKEASVAPRERVNIVYRPATGDAQEEVELPLKILVMGDFTLAPDSRPVEERDTINIDKDNFNEVMKAQNISLNMTFPNKLSGEPGEEMSANLNFENIKDFQPEVIASKIPEVNRLVELREALRALKGPLSNIPEFRKKLQDLVKDDAARDQILKELGIEK
jgi:type VI secretion system protein ImpB